MPESRGFCQSCSAASWGELLSIILQCGLVGDTDWGGGPATSPAQHRQGAPGPASQSAEHYNNNLLFPAFPAPLYSGLAWPTWLGLEPEDAALAWRKESKADQPGGRLPSLAHMSRHAILLSSSQFLGRTQHQLLRSQYQRDTILVTIALDESFFA